MGETRQIAVIVIIALVLGVIGLVIVSAILPLLQGDLAVSSYEATLYENGTLQEQYIYQVQYSGEYRMLYRSWEAPLVFAGSDQPYIQFVSIVPPAGSVGYAKDATSTVSITGSSDPSVENEIGLLADTSEVGIFNPAYYNAGTYTVQSTYVVHPPIEDDGTTAHLNFQFAGSDHIPYNDIRITVPADGVNQIYVYPPTLQAEKTGDTYTITGSAAANENIAVEMLAGAGGFAQIPGFRTNATDLQAQTASASFWYDLPYTVATLFGYLAKAAVLLVPVLLLFIYYHYGREKKFTVTTYLSTVPDPVLKPWQVNLLFKGDALDFDKDGYYATLLDLHRRKLISITPSTGGNGPEIRILSTETTDPYEQRVLAFVGRLSENNVLSTKTLETLVKNAQINSLAEEKALLYQKNFADVTTRADTTIAYEYMVDGRDHISPFIAIGAVFCAITVLLALILPDQSASMIPAVVLMIIAVIQLVIAWAAPSTLFGHWKEDHYKDKLEWDAFAHFLSDLAMIRKYAPEDLPMWGDWLVYGTALGVGDKVEEAMKALNIPVAETGVPMGVMGMNAFFIPIVTFMPMNQGGPRGGFGGGRGGFGGGFGGGGAGGRR